MPKKPLQKTGDKTYRELNEELDRLLEWFNGDDFNIDEAEPKYKQASELIAALQSRISKLENVITSAKQSFEES